MVNAKNNKAFQKCNELAQKIYEITNYYLLL